MGQDALSRVNARIQGTVDREKAREFESDLGPIGGFLGSAVSSFGELFGQDPTPAAQEFRNANPIAGFASTILPTMVPYVGQEMALAKFPSYAKAIAGATDKAAKGFGLAKKGWNAVDNPILYGGVQGMVRYSPVELSRLGVGLATAPEDNYGDLLADVGISTLLGGVGGGVLGFFKAGGKLAAEQGRVIGADLAFKPTFELRMLKARQEAGEEALVRGTMNPAEVQQNLLREVLTEMPHTAPMKGTKVRYVDALEGSTPEADKALNGLFKAQSSRVSGKALDETGLDKRLLIEGAADDKRTLNAGELQEVLTGAGFADVEDLASTLVYPRLLTPTSPRSAGGLAAALKDNPALVSVGDGTLMAREAQSGLWVVAKRIKSGAADGQKAFGPARIAAGDRWLIGKTDKPQKLVPDAHKVAELNVAQWAKYREPFKPQGDDIFNRGADAMLQAMTPGDYRDLARMTKQKWISRQTEKLANWGADYTGLKGSASARATADWIYDTFKPTMFRENDNPLFGRLFGLLRNNMRVADERVNLIMRGKVQMGGTPSQAIRGSKVTYGEGVAGARPIEELVDDMSPAELQLFADAATSQTPAADLAKLRVDGLVSPKVADAIEQLQRVNAQVLRDDIIPALEAGGITGIEWLEGYAMPRVWKGDWHVKVLDENGKERFLATGKNGAAAQAEAKAVVEEAAARGIKLRADKAIIHSVDSPDDMTRVSEQVRSRLSKDVDLQDVIQSALRNVRAASGGKVADVRPSRAPGFTKERTGRAGSPDRMEYEAEDIKAAIRNHYRQLYRFAGYHTWNQRWHTEAFNLSKMDPTLAKDLQRKAGQFMGLEGKITNVLNDVLKPVLGPLLGAKPATRIAQQTNELMYNWNLAIANPTFALLNLLTPLQTVAPWVSYVTGVAPEYAGKMMQFVPRYGPEGLPRGGVGFFHPMKVLREATKALRNPGDELKQMMEQGLSDGTLGAQLYEEFVQGGAKGTLRDVWQKEGGWEFIKKTATYMAEKSEQYSRMVAFNSGYLVGRDHFGLAGDQLYRFARRTTEVTMYNYSVVDRSRIFTGPVGSVMGLFKNWQFHFIGTMAEYAGVGLKQGVWAPMMWQGGAALALGGLGAAGPLKMMADGLARWHSDSESSFMWLQENWHDSADEIYFGLPAFLGASLQASASLPGTDVRNEVSSLMNVVLVERLKALGKAVGAGWTMAEDGGKNPLADANIRDQLQAALLPRAFFRASSAMEGDYIKSMSTGYPQIQGVSPASRILHGLGMNQIEVERQQVAGRELFNDQRRTQEATAALGTRYAAAQAAGDWNEMQMVLDRALALNVSVSSVVRSAQTRERREAGSLFDRYDKAKVERYMGAMEGR